MTLDFNSNFLDEKSDSYKYYVGIPNFELSNIEELSPILKKFLRSNLKFLGICQSNFNLSKFKFSNEKKSSILSLLKEYLNNISKKLDYPCFFSCNISANPLGYFNFFDCNFIYKGCIKNLADLINWLDYDKTTFICIKKPHTGILNLPLDNSLKEKFRLIEISNYSYDLSFSSYEHIYFHMLDKGWKLGAISSFSLQSSSEQKQWHTGIITKDIYSNLLIESLKARLSYATISKTLKLFFSINFTPMGKTLTAQEDDLLSFYIFVEDSENKITGVDIISKGGNIIKSLNTVPLKCIRYVFKRQLYYNEQWFLIRVVSNNTVLSISSPVFIEKKK
ncbi:hypothetical protein [Inconstantimicrobium mannanitabidum]|uniref:Uncharacterized protein n=1 Tax=Inconstantimicrobium mannanitabidum TaxID=1604901 RepID=A0ACB5RCF6_9CLOT|nr:hypothetical protein [Clostridium sp. TW13]GKX66771.1 hypothetical protein rsdtw13_20290 [Clostridium sp. TW13]